MFAVAVVALAHPTARSLMAGIIVAGVGEAIRIWAAGHLEKSREVTKSGPYRFFRHPLYVGSTVMGVGLGVAAHSIGAAILVGAYLVVTLTAAIHGEEAFLRRTFGREYDGYANGSAVGQDRRFSARRAMRNREYRAVAGIVVIIGLLALKMAW
jgi:protein-S-isoprenylcysteine O-methyltransferase Ste14